ncbi:MAG: restriction endonuclease [Lachnospiraceae bacterium]|nr:restriction endonuclease [Lachnospiraceae bacterium]
MSNYDTEQIKKAKVIIKKYNNSSASLLQVELKVSYEDAVSLINIINTESNTSNNAKPVGNSNPISTNTPDLSILDALESHDFEYFCADILSYNGFTGIKVTSGSGDYGIDILCKKGGSSYAIQCKCYSGNVGNHAVQEAVSGKIYYKQDYAVVMTNSHFTKAAMETARLTDALLWERSDVSNMYKNALANGYTPKQSRM